MLGIAIGLGLLALTTAIHFESLNLIARAPRQKMSRRQITALVTAGVVAAHLLEILVFAAAYFFLHQWLGVRGFSDGFEPGYTNYLFHSATCFTTLGISTYSVTEDLKLVSALQALNGFALITWSATFVYSAIGRFWK